MVTLYVEGGGPSNLHRSKCRAGFREFLMGAGLQKLPSVHASGARQQAYNLYCKSLREGKPCMLLVDSEGAVSAAHQSGAPEGWQPWQHLNARDGWNKPPAAEDLDCHLMVQFMETWFLADRAALKARFGQRFQESQLPQGAALEAIPKADVERGLKQATRNCKTPGRYDKRKGKLSYELLRRLDPEKVIAASPWAKRFVETLKQRLGA